VSASASEASGECTVVLTGDTTPAWAPAGAAVLHDSAVLDPADAERWDTALIDATSVDPIAAARRLRARQPPLQLIIVTPGHTRADIQRAVTFSPGLGEVWIEEPAAIEPELLRRAAEVTRQRRRYQVTRGQLTSAISALRPAVRAEPYVSDAYLAALLQVIPDPILSIDDQDHVLSWSPAAEQWLRPQRTGTGSALAELLQPLEPDRFEDLLRRGRSATVREAIGWRGSDGGARVAEVTVTPLEVGGHRIRAVVLRDTTEQQLAQQQLEEQALELEAQTEQLASQRDEMARLADTRSRFYASMSHELRTPINAILGYNDLLLAGVYGELVPEQAAGIERAQSAARHLRELVNDVLDLSKIEAGKIGLIHEDVLMDELVRDVVATIQPAAEEDDVAIDCTLDPGIVVHTDPRRVRQILLNLLSNAVKFGGGRPVSVTLRSRDGEYAAVSVEDRGIGIGPAELERVFEEFVQLNGSERGGTGLGLAISRRLADALGGRIEAASEVGAGSRFTLLLPAAAASR
jgi:PAS domain S-box-containing protein